MSHVVIFHKKAVLCGRFILCIYLIQDYPFYSGNVLSLVPSFCSNVLAILNNNP